MNYKYRVFLKFKNEKEDVIEITTPFYKKPSDIAFMMFEGIKKGSSHVYFETVSGCSCAYLLDNTADFRITPIKED